MQKEPSRTSNGRMRACLNCSIIQSIHSFKSEGCPNCAFLEVNKNKNVYLCTSSSFKGTIFLKDPKQSWVAKWQRISHCIPGKYALTVKGDLRDDFIYKVEQEGRVYHNRSQSFKLG